MTSAAPSIPSPLPELTKQEKVLTMVGTLLGLLLAALDQTIVATAGPAIMKDLAIEPSLYTWITTAYLVASTVLVPIYGKLSDIIGRRAVLVTGILIFLFGSLLCGVAATPLQLIIFRAIQGLGSAALFTSAFAVVADIFPPAERGKYQGMFGAVFGLSSVVGPLLGGFITDNIGWHWCFFVNLPVGGVALALILSKMPALKSNRAKPKIDVLGAVVLAVGVVPLLLALSLGKTSVAPGETGYLWGSPEILGLFGVAVVGIVFFIFLEQAVKDPLMDMKLFSNKAFAIGNAAAFVSGAGFLGAIIFLPLFMVNVVGLSATRSGLTTIPLTMGIVFGNIFTGQMVSRLGRYKGFILGSLVILVAGFAIMGFTLTAESTQLEVTFKMIVVGVGLGPSIPLFTLAIQNSVQPHQIGVATSTATFFRQMGSTVGIAIMGTFFAAELGSSMKTEMAAATQGIPPEYRAQFMGGAPGGAPAEEGAAPQRGFNAAAVKESIQQRFASQRELIKSAVEQDDPKAVQALLKEGRLDPRMKEALEKGGVRASVRQGFSVTLAKVDAALAAGTADAFTALAQDATLPPPARERLAAMPAAAVQDPQARQGALMGLKQGLQASALDAEKQAVEAAMKGASQGLDGAEQQALDAVERIGGALKRAFTAAIRHVYQVSILIALLALLITLALPELPLRKTNAMGPPPPAMD